MFVINQAFSRATLVRFFERLCCLKRASSTRQSHKCHSERQRRISVLLPIKQPRSLGYCRRMTSRDGLWRRDPWIVRTVLSLIIVFLAASPTNVIAQDKKLDSFTISYASVSGTRGPLWIAKDLGLFEKYGLEGNLIYIASGVVSVNALLSGSVDIIAASGSSAVEILSGSAASLTLSSAGLFPTSWTMNQTGSSVPGLLSLAAVLLCLTSDLPGFASGLFRSTPASSALRRSLDFITKLPHIPWRYCYCSALDFILTKLSRLVLFVRSR